MMSGDQTKPSIPEVNQTAIANKQLFDLVVSEAVKSCKDPRVGNRISEVDSELCVVTRDGVLKYISLNKSSVLVDIISNRILENGYANSLDLNEIAIFVDGNDNSKYLIANRNYSTVYKTTDINISQEGNHCYFSYKGTDLGIWLNP